MTTIKLILVLLFVCSTLALAPEFYALKVIAVATKTPVPKITLKWETEQCTTTYKCQSFTIFKSIYSPTSLTPAEFSAPILTEVSNTTYQYEDTNVTVGTRYVYKLRRNNFAGTKPLNPETYLLSGIEVPFIEYFGKVIFVVETDVVTYLGELLKQHEEDLIGDGWGVVRVVVNKTTTVAETKTLIRQTYLSNSDAKAVYLFGSVPVPYSGNMAPDGHYPDHYGAWPTDLYYGDAEEGGVWTDNINYNYISNNPRQNNTAGDGKFDQSYLSFNYVQELQVGRVDLAITGQNETKLLENYIIKNHNFRHAISSFKRRALVRDSFGEFGGEAFAQSGWKAYNVLIGNNNVIKYLNSTAPSVLINGSTDDYLFFYGCGGGGPQSMSGTGSSNDFATWKPKFAFTMLFGSYFGDFEYNNVFLKAPLVGGSGLTSVWAGRPAWSFFHGGLGYNIGRSTWASQSSSKQIHMALMGDPTLRFFVVAPPSNFRYTRSGPVITWNASPDPKVVGYHLYGSTGKYQTFWRRSTSLLTSLTFNRTNSGGGVYMVRAIKLEVTSSGSYFNPSQGVFLSVPAVSTTATSEESQISPTIFPTAAPPTVRPPTLSPTKPPTESPTRFPTEAPTKPPTVSPTRFPTDAPPTRNPTVAPPTRFPTEAPPTKNPTVAPPTRFPTEAPPTRNPTVAPPTRNPTVAPPTRFPTEAPPTRNPTVAPPTRFPTDAPPTRNPTIAPPTRFPTDAPPTRNPTVAPPTRFPTDAPPTRFPTEAPPTRNPTVSPTRFPTEAPPTRNPTVAPPTKPPGPSVSPTLAPPTKPPGPTVAPPTKPPGPSVSPTRVPTEAPPTKPPGPSVSPTRNPTLAPPTKPPGITTTAGPIVPTRADEPIVA